MLQHVLTAGSPGFGCHDFNGEHVEYFGWQDHAVPHDAVFKAPQDSRFSRKLGLVHGSAAAVVAWV